MTTDLENTLVTAMREHAAGITLDRPLVGPARRHVTRRRAATAAVSAGCTLTLAAAVATVTVTGVTVTDVTVTDVTVTDVTVTGTPSTPAPRPPSSADAAVAPAVTLDMAYVAARVEAALAESRDSVLQVRTSVTKKGGFFAANETWWDLSDDTQRNRELSASGDPVTELHWAGGASGVDTVTVDYTRRIWYSESLPAGREGSTVPTMSQVIGSSPQQIRDALAGGDGWTLVGREDISGRAVLHLRSTDGHSPAPDMWVDASTYEVVRTAGTKPTDSDALDFRIDYSWSPRDAAELSRG